MSNARSEVVHGLLQVATGHRSQVTASKLSAGVGEALRADASQSEGRALRKCAGPL